MFQSRLEDKALAAPQYVVEGLIPEDADVVLYAPWAFLKSFVAMDMFYACATGVPALNNFAVPHSGPCFYFAGEGHRALVKKRSVAWEIEHGYQPYYCPNVLFADGVPLTDKAEHVADAIAEVKELLGDNKAKLFVVDTMSRALNGQKEDEASTGRYLNIVREMRKHLGGSSLTVAHEGKDRAKGIRGSSVSPAGFDAILNIEDCEKLADSETPYCHVISLRVTKQKDGEDGQCYFFRSKLVDTQDGQSLVLDAINEEEFQAYKLNKKAKPVRRDDEVDEAEQAHNLFDALNALVGKGGEVGASMLTRKLEEMTGEDSETWRKRLQRGRDNLFRQYYRKESNKWCLPGSHLPGSRESVEDQLKSAKQEGIFH